MSEISEMNVYQCFNSGWLTGVVLGDLHFITFDGLGYTFSGRGEYCLVSSADRELSVQARTEQVKRKNGEALFHVDVLSSFIPSPTSPLHPKDLLR